MPDAGMTMGVYTTSPGRSYPLGATPDREGVNFSIWGYSAWAAELLLYEASDSREPFQVILLDSEIHKTFHCWHVYVEGLRPGVWYGWRMDGPCDTSRSGHRFNRNKILLDPCARAVSDHLWDRSQACRPEDNGASSMRAMVVDSSAYDWEGDQPLNHPLEKSIFYELHVGGFTRHPSSESRHPGTFAALVEKIPYLQALGITDVELLPVMAFDEQDVPPAVSQRGLRNFWGYSTHSLFCPHPGYCVHPEAGEHLREFRNMVKAFHRAGIGVILDVVFNHTAEGGSDGPTIHFKGLGNAGFYHLDPGDRSIYRDFTGCGNTINCSHPLVTDLLLESLRFWVNELHVDGFRFDLASVLSRDMAGQPSFFAPVPWAIELSATLAKTRIIAEAWDAAGLYQVGGFPGFRWAEWNGRYRDLVRRFVRGDRGLVNELATRISGSSDLYQPAGRLPTSSVNFITCHDGFTLYDLVSFNEKHNQANGEDNRDGSNDNWSWNCGWEGETNDPRIHQLRRHQLKNFIVVLLVSQGVPMLLAGDEALRTQSGNNNAYCQDNETSWFDWTLVGRNQDMVRFVREMIALRKRHPALMRQRFLTGRRKEGHRFPDVAWHGIRLNAPPWDDGQAQYLAFTLGAAGSGESDLHVMLNMSENPLQMQIPPIEGGHWFRAVDTALSSPIDILPPADQAAIQTTDCRVEARSIVILEGRSN